MDPITLITFIAALLLPLAELVGGKLLKLDGTKSRLLSWLFGALLGLGAAVLGLTGGDLLQGALYGVLAALVANGVFSIEQVRKILEVLKLRDPKALAQELLKEAVAAQDPAQGTPAPAQPSRTVADILRQRGR